MHEHGLDVEVLAVGAGCIALWALAARRLAGWNVSSAMAMVVLGLVVANEPLDLIAPSPTSATVRLLVELTLALVLFSDALAGQPARTARGPGAPGPSAARRAAPHDRGWASAPPRCSPISIRGCAAVVAAALAPTDAALGAPVVADRHVPMRIRRTLNVESGLNDGLVTPMVTFFVAGAVAEAGKPARPVTRLGTRRPWPSGWGWGSRSVSAGAGCCGWRGIGPGRRRPPPASSSRPSPCSAYARRAAGGRQWLRRRLRRRLGLREHPTLTLPRSVSSANGSASSSVSWCGCWSAPWPSACSTTSRGEWSASPCSPSRCCGWSRSRSP